jgi:hypothetical protein
MAELNPASVAVSSGTPYVTPQMLLSAPTGIVWSTLGPGAKPTEQQQFNEQVNLCRRSTSMIDGYCNQPLRATLDQEVLYGPGDFRFHMQPNGNARLLLSRSPVTQVLNAYVTLASQFPPVWTAVGPANVRVEKPLIGVYGTSVPSGSDNAGQAVLLAPGNVSWLAGRLGYMVAIEYVNGWPHGSLTEPVAVGDMTVSMDDCAGWGPPPASTLPAAASGAAGTIYDPGWQEVFTTVAASSATGPGVLTLAAAAAYAHPVGTMVSTLPNSIIQAAILYCVAQALVRGATATTIQAMPGSESIAGGRTGEDLATEAELLVHPYKRVI